MFSMHQIIGTLFSATAVRLASMALAVYVALTIGGEAIGYLQGASDALSATLPTAP